jgi:serine/threonine-protein kinase RsbW
MGRAPQSAGSNSRDTVHLEIESQFEELAQVHSLIEDLGRRHHLGDELVNALQIAVIEAGTNAIQHGNVFSEDKSVRFHFTVAPREIVVRVDDFGRGFDPTRLPNPTEGESLLSPHGRGIHLMRALMDEVKIESRPDHGTTVLLRKTRSPNPS